jgi:hypothetical protein
MSEKAYLALSGGKGKGNQGKIGSFSEFFSLTCKFYRMYANF